MDADVAKTAGPTLYTVKIDLTRLLIDGSQSKTMRSCDYESSSRTA
ncbi:uncharacterized protein RAG0_16325 [Rhynchosporium agropyri]|uniref:Uncharacterized protein n=2 Tax=Rhynchosporium TaxID=38037 RepID=A0A1E1MRL9_RHYSE|nr:uncharacterized protein RAG0_16325 [Rhynchosporium agropyri]CZT51425.1 uncharacterized protein RSE6_12570 [Rhynchosporium secalis]